MNGWISKTRTVQNGDPLVREVEWGLVVKLLTVLGTSFMVLVTAAIIWYTNRVSAAIDLVPLMFERQQQVIQRLDKIDKRLEAEGDVMTRDEFARWLDSQERAISVRRIAEGGR